MVSRLLESQKTSATPKPARTTASTSTSPVASASGVGVRPVAGGPGMRGVVGGAHGSRSYAPRICKIAARSLEDLGKPGPSH